MVEVRDESLVFHFPEVHEGAQLRISFYRTVRIPDDGKTYFLPPGLGKFPLRHVDDYADRIPQSWMKNGGVMLPMYQSEALWMDFQSYIDKDAEKPLRGFFPYAYPFAVQVATGKIDAITGDTWQDCLARNKQNYIVVPEQPWLDGYCVEKGIIRQFVAMPLGQGYTVEEQLTGAAVHGGIQIAVYPMKQKRFKELQTQWKAPIPNAFVCCGLAEFSLGLAPGGKMRQEIYEDPYGWDAWETSVRKRCFVHILNSQIWKEVTGEPMPTKPITARDYATAGLPWFDYYDEKATALEGFGTLDKLKSIAAVAESHGHKLEDNETVDEGFVKILYPNKKHLFD